MVIASFMAEDEDQGPDPIHRARIPRVAGSIHHAAGNASSIAAPRLGERTRPPATGNLAMDVPEIRDHLIRYLKAIDLTRLQPSSAPVLIGVSLRTPGRFHIAYPAPARPVRDAGVRTSPAGAAGTGRTRGVGGTRPRCCWRWWRRCSTTISPGGPGGVESRAALKPANQPEANKQPPAPTILFLRSSRRFKNLSDRFDFGVIPDHHPVCRWIALAAAFPAGRAWCLPAAAAKLAVILGANPSTWMLLAAASAAAFSLRPSAPAALTIADRPERGFIQRQRGFGLGFAGGRLGLPRPRRPRPAEPARFPERRGADQRQLGAAAVAITATTQGAGQTLNATSGRSARRLAAVSLALRRQGAARPRRPATARAFCSLPERSGRRWVETGALVFRNIR